MMSPGVQSKELAIEHVRQRVERIPLAGRPFGESPADSFAGQPRRDQWIGEDEEAVVVTEQHVIERLAIDEPDRHD